MNALEELGYRPSPFLDDGRDYGFSEFVRYDKGDGRRVIRAYYITIDTMDKTASKRSVSIGEEARAGKFTVSELKAVLSMLEGLK